MRTRLHHGRIQDRVQPQEARSIVQVLHLALEVLQVVHPVVSLHRGAQDRLADRVVPAVQVVEVQDVKSDSKENEYHCGWSF